MAPVIAAASLEPIVAIASLSLESYFACMIAGIKVISLSMGPSSRLLMTIAIDWKE